MSDAKPQLQAPEGGTGKAKLLHQKTNPESWLVEKMNTQRKENRKQERKHRTK